MLSADQLANLRIVLVDTRNPLNIGAAARAVSNFGFSSFRLVHPYDVAFQGARSAVGAAKILETAEVYETLPEAIADCTLIVGTTAVRHRELHLALRRLDLGAKVIQKHLALKSTPHRARAKNRNAAASPRANCVALLFGSEKFGLSNQDLSHCHWLMRIPTREEHISMNLGQAVAVCLYELIRDPKKTAAFERPPEKLIPANAGEVERFTEGPHRGAQPQRFSRSPHGRRCRRPHSPPGSPLETSAARRRYVDRHHASNRLEAESPQSRIGSAIGPSLGRPVFFCTGRARSFPGMTLPS
jgi:TrmH family RNA methyltransferase